MDRIRVMKKRINQQLAKRRDFVFPRSRCIGMVSHTLGRFHREMKYPDKIIIFECMPTILFIYGWRLFFYSNEGLEPMHVHAEKGDMECKFWLLIEEVEIREEFAFNLNPASKKEIKKIIYQHFDLIVDAWNKHFKN